MQWLKLEGKRLKARLLEAGLAPRYVRRVTRELGDHLNDIEAELTASGMRQTEAAHEARRRLGTIDQLESQILARHPRRSVIARYPALSFSVGTAALAVLLVAGTLEVMILVADGLKSLGVNHGQLVTIFGSWHYYFLRFVACPAIAGFACWMAYFHRVKLRWPLVAALLLAVAGGVFLDAQLMITNTGPEPHGQYSIGFGLYSHELIRSVWRLVSPLAVFAAFTLWARTRGRDAIGYRMEL